MDVRNQDGVKRARTMNLRTRAVFRCSWRHLNGDVAFNTGS